jgi:ribosomal protein S18 acetylase RimI-like enzyme
MVMNELAFRDDYTVAIEDNFDEAWDVVSDGHFKFNREVAGLKRTPPIAAVVRDKENTVKGGLFGNSNWDIFDIDVLWVAEEHRKLGLGSNLLRHGEQVAIQRGCKIAVVLTFSFQARGFYEKQGYKVFGELNGYPAGYSSYWMSKKLV